MKKAFYLLSALLGTAFILGLVSCNKDNGGQKLPAAKITGIKYYPEDKMTAYNIEYPSTDPFGNPVTLSGAITVGDEIKDGKAPAVGVVLVNHFTVYRKDQCPSKGDLMIQKFVVGSHMVGVSSDYYGFGSTEDKNQAYCIGSVNAQASIDCLIAARELFPSINISIDKSKDFLFNLGYSEGGQTTVAVERLVAEKYPDIKITHSFAGGGPYDMPATYREMTQTDISGMPSTIISVMLAFNEYAQMGYSRDRLLRGDALAHVDDWLLSKRYTQQEIDAMIGSLSFSNFASTEIQDMNSAVSRKLMQALEKENLTKTWRPAKGARIALIHHKKDITVPIVNQYNLYDYLVKTLGLSKDDITATVVGDITWMDDMPAHENGAIDFAITIFRILIDRYGFDFWLLNEENVAQMLEEFLKEIFKEQ